MSNAQMSAEEIKKHVRTYLGIFVALLFLTVVTVAVSYLHLPVFLAVAVALLVAGVKGSLVALYFMHLLHEQKIIYWVLGITAFLFGVLLLIGLT